MSHRRWRAAFALLLATGASGCSLILAPICLARQHRAPVATLTGDVQAGAVIVHRVAYGTAGSQNDLALRWNGQREPGGPRLKVYLTPVGCQVFDPARVSTTRGDVCTPIGSRGSVMVAEELVQVSAGITHGRGNPPRLGPTPAGTSCGSSPTRGKPRRTRSRSHPSMDRIADSIQLRRDCHSRT